MERQLFDLFVGMKAFSVEADNAKKAARKQQRRR